MFLIMLHIGQNRENFYIQEHAYEVVYLLRSVSVSLQLQLLVKATIFFLVNV